MSKSGPPSRQHQVTERRPVASKRLTTSGVISMSRSPLKAKDRSRRSYRIHDFHYDVEVRSSREFPFGADFDICGAIETLFACAAAPADNRLIVTPASLLRASGNADYSSASYVRLREGLERLEAVSWTVERYRVSDPDGMREKHFTRLISEMTMYQRRVDTHMTLMPEGNLIIHLSPSFAGLIRDEFLQKLDINLLQKLKQPGARALYRILESHRLYDDESDQMRSELTITLRDWCQACGLLPEAGDGKPRYDHAKRAIETASAQLVKAKYLLDFSITGRGAQSVVHYAFAPVELDVELYERLIKYGVTEGRARSLATREKTAARRGLNALEARLAGGWVAENPAAALMHAIQHPAQYEGGAPVKVDEAAFPVPRQVLRQVEEDCQPLLEVNVEVLKKSISFMADQMLRRGLTPDEYRYVIEGHESHLRELSRSLISRLSKPGTADQRAVDAEQILQAYIQACQN